MQQQTITTYSFDELSKEAQAKAIELYADINVDYIDWAAFLIDEWKKKLQALGYDDPTILYSGFYSQGDGACFEATVDLKAWMKAHKLAGKYHALHNDAENVNITIRHSGHYYHELSTTVSAEYYGNNSEKREKQLDAIVKTIKQDREELGKNIYQDLAKEYEYQTEQETIAYSIRANDFQFLENGSKCLYV